MRHDPRTSTHTHAAGTHPVCLGERKEIDDVGSCCTRVSCALVIQEVLGEQTLAVAMCATELNVECAMRDERASSATC